MRRQSAITLESELTVHERAALIRLFKRAQLAGKHLEIGTAAGGTLREMMLAYSAETRPPFVVVDSFRYFPDQRQAVERNLALADLDPRSVDFREQSSGTAYYRAAYGEETFSFILIDADHHADFVMRDLRWARLLEEGGHLCLHDYGNPKFPGVQWATDRFLRRNSNYVMEALVDSLAILHKRGRESYVSPLDVALSWVERQRHSVRKRISRLRDGR